MSDSQSPATPQNLVSIQTTGSGKSLHGECAPCDVKSTPWIAESDVASAGSGKRKLLEEEFSNGARKRVRNDGLESGSSDTNEISLEGDEEKIGQPRVGYPITAPLVKMKSTPVRAPAALDVPQGNGVHAVATGVVPEVEPGVFPGIAPGVVSGVVRAVAPGVDPGVVSGGVAPAAVPGIPPRVVPGVVPAVAPGVVHGVVPGMIPALPMPLGVSGGVGGLPMLSFGGAVGATPLSMATIATHLHALQMNQLLRAFAPSVNSLGNLGKLLTSEQMAMLATRMTMASRVSPQVPHLHTPRPALLGVSSSSAPSSVSISTTGNSFNRPTQGNETSTPGGTWVHDRVRQTHDNQREVGRTIIADGDNSHSDFAIDHHSEATTENSSESDEARFRVSDPESGNGVRGGQEAAAGSNGHHQLMVELQNQQQDQGYLERDQGYQERRRKNNDSARRSRDARRTRIDETAKRVAFLEMENLQMRAIIEAEREYLTRMQQDLMQRKGAWNQTQFAALRQVLDNMSATSAARFYSSGQQPLVTTLKSSSAVKEERTNGPETQRDCDTVKPS